MGFISGVFWWIMQFADRFIVESQLNESELGIYSLAKKIPSLVNVFIGIFYQAWGLSAFREVESDNDNSFFSETFVLYSTGLIGVTLCIISVIKPFMRIYVGEDFLDATQYIPTLLTSTIFYGLSVFFGVLYEAHKKTLRSLAPVVLAGAADVALCFLLLPLYGLWGATLATFISNLIYFIYMMIDVGRNIVEKNGIRVFLFNSFIMLAITASVSMDLYALPVSALCIIFFMIVNRDLLVKIIRKFAFRQ